MFLTRILGSYEIPDLGFTPALVALMSLATGLSVACHYDVQSLLTTIAHPFARSFHQARLVGAVGVLLILGNLFFLVARPSL